MEATFDDGRRDPAVRSPEELLVFLNQFLTETAQLLQSLPSEVTEELVQWSPGLRFFLGVTFRTELFFVRLLEQSRVR